MNDQVLCLLCQVSGPAEVVSTGLRDDPTGHFRVMRCLTCGHVQIFPLPKPEEDATFYENDGQTRNLLGEADLQLWQRKTAADTDRRVQWLRSVLPKGGEVLDVGCGYGFFVDKASREGYRALGLDVGRDRLLLAQHHLHGTFVQGEINDEFINRYRRQFHVVTLFHVLEHVSTPVLFIRQCFELIAPGGWLLIEVPNANDELLKHKAEYRAFYWQRAHLSYFDPASLALALRRAGLGCFSLQGVQRYGLHNLLHWLDEGKPELPVATHQTTEAILVRIERLYKEDRERTLTCDTLIVEIQK